MKLGHLTLFRTKMGHLSVPATKYLPSRLPGAISLSAHRLAHLENSGSIIYRLLNLAVVAVSPPFVRLPFLPFPPRKPHCAWLLASHYPQSVHFSHGTHFLVVNSHFKPDKYKCLTAPPTASMNTSPSPTARHKDRFSVLLRSCISFHLGEAVQSPKYSFRVPVLTSDEREIDPISLLVFLTLVPRASSCRHRMR
jgi:hypothetical protein